MRKYGLLGKRLDYSFSRAFFEEKFQREAIDAVYENIEIPDAAHIPEVLKAGFEGMNVTVPYKEAVIPYLDELSEEASAIGAVNTIVFREGKAIGHNTDAFGFHQSIKPFLTNKHERALIIGTGGAAKAVAHIFKGIGVDVLYVSRAPQGDRQFPYEAVNEYMIRACGVIVQTTPVGTFPDTENTVPFPFEFLTEDHLVVDLIYNPEATLFLRKASKQGAVVLNGRSMLKEQALKAWEIWNRTK